MQKCEIPCKKLKSRAKVVIGCLLADQKTAGINEGIPGKIT